MAWRAGSGTCRSEPAPEPVRSLPELVLRNLPCNLSFGPSEPTPEPVVRNLPWNLSFGTCPGTGPSNDRFRGRLRRTGSGTDSGAGFRTGSKAGSERKVPNDRFRGRFRTTGRLRTKDSGAGSEGYSGNCIVWYYGTLVL